MYWKLAIQNIRRSLRDYIIYFVTLTFTALCDVLLVGFFGMAFIVFCAVQNRHPCIDDQEYSKIEIA